MVRRGMYSKYIGRIIFEVRVFWVILNALILHIVNNIAMASQEFHYGQILYKHNRTSLETYKKYTE